MKQRTIILAIIFSLLPFSQLAANENKDDRHFSIIKNLDIFNALFRELDLFYVDSINSEKLVRSAIDNMLLELDPYTTYIPESEMEGFKYMTTGEYGGIGAIITQRDDRVMISEPYEGMPAQKAGLKAGDYIIEINGEKLKGKTSTDASNMLRGEPGETVTIVVERPGEKKHIKKELAREKIIINPVDYYAVYNDIAYVHLSGFTDKSAAELKKALVAMKSKNKNLKGIILDLRGNSGGIIDESVSISNLFLPKGKEVVSTKGKDTQWDNVYKTLREPFDAETPMAVLINYESASASEIVAGALQDYDRAIIIGNRTYGKGLVQTTRPVGYEAYLKITTAKYYTPSGRCIQEIDYEHRDANGRAGRIADSLTNEFKTTNGRIVRDGGGIAPDITLKEIETFDISHRLSSDYLIFDYATEYCLKHPPINSIDDFKLSDEDFEDFKQYLKSKDFSYKLRSSSALKNLKEIIKLEGYEDITKEEFEALENKLVPDTDKDLEQHKDIIKELISVEIIKRYFYQQGEIREILKNDEGLKKAIEVLTNKAQYNSILSITE